MTYARARAPSEATTPDAPAPGLVWRLAHRPEAAGEAREITKQVLARWQVADEPADTVLLTVSELVTNAVVHAKPPLNLKLSRDLGTHRVHIEVSDGGPSATDGHRATGGTPEEHGRGLAIVDHLTTAHGNRQESGRAVHWADVNATA